MGMANSTGCSSVWGSTYPYNPYPFPWANHLFQDSPSLAIGLFEGHMRKMADAFAEVRRAELLRSGDYDAARDEAMLSVLDWKQFTDEEFDLCPPIVSMGGDGAMLDIGFQNLSRLLASGKPIRVVVLDTQVYSNTGGQACTSGFTGQVSDMAGYGAAQHGKTEVRKELALIALAHRGAFVHQTSQASPSHLIGGVLRGLQKRRPAVFNIYTPCPVEHGLADDWATSAAKLALESRAFPYLTFDPDAGAAMADALSLDGNPSVDSRWPSYSLKYLGDSGEECAMDLPLTIADWAATEGRFKKHFHPLKADTEDAIVFNDFLDLSLGERADRTPFIYTIDNERRLARVAVSPEIVRLAEERLEFWAQLKEMAGVSPAQSVRDRLLGAVESEYEAKLATLKAEYEAKFADLKATYPREVARRLSEALLRGGSTAAADILAATPSPTMVRAAAPIATAAPVAPPAVVAPAPMSTTLNGKPAPASVAVAAPIASIADAALETDLDPYIDSDRCTTCNECTNLNSKMFAYNASKQATIKDPAAGTFQQLVIAAERCPAGIIHPGTPRNPKEKDLAKWLKRAEPFN
jgi:pyruvate-ferredoxin/flavodoxin oxidoreductase